MIFTKNGDNHAFSSSSGGGGRGGGGGIGEKGGGGGGEECGDSIDRPLEACYSNFFSETDRPTYKQTDQLTDTPSYRNAWTHLKTCKFKKL